MHLVLIVWLAGVCATIVHQLLHECSTQEAAKQHSVIHFYNELPDRKHKNAFAMACFFGVVLWFISFTYLAYVLFKKADKSPSD